MKLMKSSLHQTRSNIYAYRNPVYLCLIILSGAVLRFHDLGTESFWIDEIFTIHLIRQDLPTLIQQLATQGRLTRNAFYFLVAHFWVLPFGITETSIRALSAIFGILSIAMIYLVGRQLFGVKVGLISSFLMAISEFQIQYSQAARFYSLFVLLTLLSVYCYIGALKTKNPWFWVFTSLFNILLFYTHTSAIFMFTAEYIHYFICWKRFKNNFVLWVFSQFLLVLAIIPSLIPAIRLGSLAAGLGNSLAWIGPPTIKDLLRTVYNYLFPQNYLHSWFFIIGTFAAALTFFALTALILNLQNGRYERLATLCRWLCDKRFQLHISNQFVLISLWFVLPVILPFIYSIMFTPVFQDRYTICAAPAFYLLTATAIARIRRIVPVYVTLFALMIVVLPGLQDYYAADVNEQWREAAAYVQENAQSNDVVIYAPDEEGFQHKSFDWYYRGYILGCGISSKPKDNYAMAEAVSNCTLGHDRFWVIIRGTPEVVNRMKVFFLGPDQTTLQLIKEQQLVQISVYLFELRE